MPKVKKIYEYVNQLVEPCKWCDGTGWNRKSFTDKKCFTCKGIGRGGSDRMRKSDGAINRLINWFFGEPLPEECYPDVDEFGNGAEARQIRRIAEFCLVLLIILTTLYFGLGNFLAGTPEPEWWIRVVEPWLLSLFF